jgi:Uma2 family endonuclease
MDWSEVITDPALHNLPYKIELNERGQIVMSPASNEHGLYQMTIGTMLNNMKKEGKTLSECSLQTRKGVKVADVAWLSAKFLQKFGKTTPYPAAPELCIEILSPSNTEEEMQEKIDLYLAKGAQEVWLISLDGKITFYDHAGIMAHSQLFPQFPQQLEE